MTTFALTTSQVERAGNIATAALKFTDARSASLPYAVIRYLWFDGSSRDVVEALATYQNEDGGFGNRLEPDIHASASNPFAARIAMQLLRVVPEAETEQLRERLAVWLINHQHDDGDWHFSEDVKGDFMQPWFAAWEFPAINPACCVAGLAQTLDLATPEMLNRVASLFAEKASVEQVQNGGFYDLLPYVEYSSGVQIPDDFTEAIANSIVNRAQAGEFEDAEHFFTLALGGSSAITQRIPAELFGQQTERLLQEPLADGGWTTPYDDAWRVWTTATNLVTLAKLKRGVALA